AEQFHSLNSTSNLFYTNTKPKTPNHHTHLQNACCCCHRHLRCHRHGSDRRPCLSHQRHQRHPHWQAHHHSYLRSQLSVSEHPPRCRCRCRPRCQPLSDSGPLLGFPLP
ncbi:uncharacterized protein TRIVIDRAFT_215793, partial [Trichoderma virens Gv29-8]